MLGRAVAGHEIGETVEHVVGAQSPCDDDREAAPRELVDHRQHAKLAPVLSLILHEVVAPDVIWPLRPQTDARSVVEPETAAFGLFLRDFQPFPPPDPIDALDADAPAFVDEQLAHAAIPVATVLLGEPNDRVCQRRLVVADFRRPALRRARLADDRARTPLRYGQLRAHVIHARPLPGRAQYFPVSASFRISLSSVSSETAFFSRSFSRSSSLSRFA